MLNELLELTDEEWRKLCAKMMWYYRSPPRPIPVPFTEHVPHARWAEYRRLVKKARTEQHDTDLETEVRKAQEKREYMRQYMRGWRASRKHRHG